MRRSAIGGVVLLVAVATVAAGMASCDRRKSVVKLKISKETTYLTEPVRKDGWIDYLGEVQSRRKAGVKGRSNAAVALLKGVGPKLIDKHHGYSAADIAKALGIEDLEKEGKSLAETEEYKKAKGAKREVRSTLLVQDPELLEWMAERCPLKKGQSKTVDLAAWIEGNQRAIDYIVEASEADGIYFPGRPKGKDRFELTVVSPLRVVYAGRAVRCRAAARLLEGECEKSWSDTKALWRLGLLFSTNNSAVPYAAAGVLWSTAFSATADLARSGGCDSGLLESMKDYLAGLPEFTSVRGALELELLYTLEVMRVVNSLPRKELVERGLPTDTAFARLDVNAMMRNTNRRYEEIDRALQVRPYAESIEILREMEKRFKKRNREKVEGVKNWLRMVFLPREKRIGAASEVIGALVSEATMFSSKRLLEGYARAEYARLLSTLVVAVERYRSATGEYPETLSALSPRFLEELPGDPGNGEDFFYEKRERESMCCAALV